MGSGVDRRGLGRGRQMSAKEPDPDDDLRLPVGRRAFSARNSRSRAMFPCAQRPSAGRRGRLPNRPPNGCDAAALPKLRDGG